MRAFRRQTLLFAVLAAASAGAFAQLTVPRIVQLPTEDFLWTWGSGRVDERERPEFEVLGSQRQFQCTLTGSFRRGSRMRDFYEMRAFEQTLTSSLYFIEDATITLNDYYRSNHLDWASLDCKIPQGEESEEAMQERVDRALERAERARDRRRARQEDD